MSVWYMEGIISMLLKTSDERASHASSISTLLWPELGNKTLWYKRLANDQEFFLSCHSYVLENENENYIPDLQPWFPPRTHFIRPVKNFSRAHDYPLTMTEKACIDWSWSYRAGNRALLTIDQTSNRYKNTDTVRYVKRGSDKTQEYDVHRAQRRGLRRRWMNERYFFWYLIGTDPTKRPRSIDKRKRNRNTD